MNRILCLLFLSLLCTFQSCTKKESGTTAVDNKDGAVLLVSVSGVQDDDIIIANVSKVSTVLESNMEVDGEIVSHEAGFDSRVSVEKSVREDDKEGLIKKASNQAANNQAKTKMANGVYYNLMIYRASDNALVYNEVMIAGEEKKLVVDAGVAYKWNAHSYNTTVQADLGIKPTLDSPNVPMGNNQDFLYASGEITVEAFKPTPLGILFEHKTARIAVELNTMGMFADLDQAELSIDGQLVTRDFNVRTGTMTGNSSTLSSVGSNVLVTPPGYGFEDRKFVYFYTTSTANLPNLKVKLKSFKIKLDAQAVGRGVPTREFTNLTSEFTSANFAPELQKSKRFKIDLIESPITTVSNELEAIFGEKDRITTKWARTNVYYVSGHNSYRFHHLNDAPDSNSNAFFAAGAVLPNSYIKKDAKFQNPCDSVYPKGVWKQATTRDYDGLVGVPRVGGLLGFARDPLPSTFVAGHYIEYNTTAPAVVAPYNNNKLRFLLNGSGSGVSLLGNLLTINIAQFGGRAQVWAYNSGNAILDLGVNHYDGDATNRKISTNILEISLLGINLVKSNLMNVRCVRVD